MKRSIATIVACAAMMALVACSPMVEVSQDFDEATDFSGYKSYSWVPFDSTVTGDKVLDERMPVAEEAIRMAIVAEMEAKSFDAVLENPDVMIAYYIGDRKQVYVSNYGFDYNDIAGGKSVYQVRDGMIVVDMVETKTNRLVWRGVAWGAVNRDPTDQMIRDNVSRAVNKLFVQYPPGQKR